MSDWDSQRFGRAQAIPDLDHRLPDDGFSSGRLQRSAGKILVGIILVIVAIFVIVAVTDGGESNNPSSGQGDDVAVAVAQR